MQKLLTFQTSPFGELSDQCWEGSGFVAALFSFQGASRLSIARIDFSPEPLSWEDLQSVKSKCGFGMLDAVEVYPRDCDIVNTGNVRHLYLMLTPIPFAMRVQPGQSQPLQGELQWAAV